MQTERIVEQPNLVGLKRSERERERVEGEGGGEGGQKGNTNLSSFNLNV